jgi:hypothetical protein
LVRRNIVLIYSQWTVTRVAEDRYTFKSTVGNLFLATDVAQTDRPGNGTALIGREGQAAHFTVRKVPGTRFYKCESLLDDSLA